MRPHQVGIIAGLSFGSFVAMLVVLFACVAMPGLTPFLAPLATLGVFLGVFSAALVTMTIVTEPRTSRFLVTEIA